MEQHNKNNNSKQLVTISQNDLLRVYSPINCLKHIYKLKTIKNVLEAKKTPSLTQIKKSYGIEFQKTFVMTWVLYLNETLTLKRPLGEVQIEMVADLIVSEYSFLRIVDITFIFKNAISGKYGEFYESLTIPKIMSWFSNHFEQRCEAAEHVSIQNHFYFNDKWNDKVIKEMFKEIPDELPKKEKIKFDLPKVLQSSSGYIKQLTQSVKLLTEVELQTMVDHYTKYPKYKIYQNVYEKEIQNRKN